MHEFEPAEIVEVNFDDVPVVWPPVARTSTRVFVIGWVHGTVATATWGEAHLGAISDSTRRAVVESVAWALWKEEHALPRETAVLTPAEASVVVCTRDRTEDLRKCLSSIVKNAGQAKEIIVVDSAPSNDATRKLVATLPGITYVHESIPGAAVARNRGIETATGAVIAFTDDDAIVESGWLEELLHPFNDPTVAVTTGLGLPLELRTPSQVAFERLSSFIKGYDQRIFSNDSMEPLGAGNTGASVNMAVRRAALQDIGLLVESLGPGTPAKAGEDHEFLYRTLRRGYRIVYEPRAVVRHCHRRTWEALEVAVESYSTAVYAWWTHALIVEHDYSVPYAAMTWFWNNEIRCLLRSLLRRPKALPLELSLRQIRGALRGPYAYMKSRRLMRKLGARAASDIAFTMKSVSAT